MIPGPLTLAPLVQPAPAPVPLLAGGVQPRASSSHNHVTGSVDGTKTNYSDLHAFAWFAGGGWDLRNQRRLGRRGLADRGDTDEQAHR